MRTAEIVVLNPSSVFVRLYKDEKLILTRPEPSVAQAEETKRQWLAGSTFRRREQDLPPNEPPL